MIKFLNHERWVCDDMHSLIKMIKLFWEQKLYVVIVVLWEDFSYTHWRNDCERVFSHKGFLEMKCFLNLTLTPPN